MAKQSRNISERKLTIRLDLGDRNSWYRVLDEAGKIQLKQLDRLAGSTLKEPNHRALIRWSPLHEASHWLLLEKPSGVPPRKNWLARSYLKRIFVSS